ncbi:ABC transporter substrate-binding protein [Streptomyces sp. So13.3]|uniref:ABC transporter substrate-binding protein n=1 Tax=Streptomyces TaxID=1883 RepID=UPI001106F60F|nr:MULTISPECIES: ABC transporter substrate-binding protein [unclassified Streptomyces]MCZ4098718.1 ABC transporter substrate-binding protein [Streptomyces sp. H39-C1]QNA76279.1 ABC transporter substrate-binding protein [Streptomyces sp. So13.3]
MRIRRTITVTLASSLALTALAACSSTNAGNTAGASGTAASVLKIGMPNNALTANSNPYLNSSAAAGLGYRFMIYEPLGMVNDAKPVDPAKPWLATKWVWSPDYKSVVFTVRDGVKFSDGTAMTADDVAYSFQLLKDNSGLNFNGLDIASVASGGNTVTVGFNVSQFVTQAKVLKTFVVPKAIWSKMADPTKDVVAKPVGTGPYTLDSITTQNATLSLRSSGYWQTPPKVKKLLYTSYVGNDSMTTALTSGAAEWSYVFIPNAKTVYVAKDRAHNHLFFPPSLSADGLWINTTVAPFNDAKLRKAMSLVINRDDIFNQAEAGYFKPLVDSVTGLPTPAGVPFIDAKYKDKTQKVDLEGAKALLAAAGYKLAGGVLTAPSGKPVTIALTDPAGWSDYQTALTIIADNLSQIGIKATIDKADENAWGKNMGTGNFQAAMHWSNGGSTPYDMYQNIMDGTVLKPIGTDSPGGNYGRYNNPAATQALKDYANAPDEAGRTKAMLVLQDIMVNDVPMIATSAGNVGGEYSTKNWIGWPDDNNTYAGAQPTIPGALDVVLHLTPATK